MIQTPIEYAFSTDNKNITFTESINGNPQELDLRITNIERNKIVLDDDDFKLTFVRK